MFRTLTSGNWRIRPKKTPVALAIPTTSGLQNMRFPPEKKESAKKSFAEKISALIDEGGKIKECDFDLVKVMGFLIQAEACTKIKI
jgi:hypothetical protein